MRRIHLINMSDYMREDIFVPGNSDKDSPVHQRPEEGRVYPIDHNRNRIFEISPICEYDRIPFEKIIKGEQTQLFPILRVEFVTAEERIKICEKERSQHFRKFKDRYLV